MHDTLLRDDYLTDVQLQSFMREIRGRHHVHRLRNHALFATLANTGIRPGEAVKLTVGDLHLADREPWIRIRRLKSRREQGRLQDLPVSRGLARVLKRHVDKLGLAGPLGETEPATPVFPMTVRNVELLFHFYAKRARLRGRFRLYCLRHTALDRAHRASRGDLRLVQEIAGHKSPVTTSIYVRTDPVRMRRVIERTSQI